MQQFKKYEDKTCGQEFSKIGAIRDGQLYVFDLKRKNESQIQNGDEVVLVPNKAGLITQCWYRRERMCPREQNCGKIPHGFVSFINFHSTIFIQNFFFFLATSFSYDWYGKCFSLSQFTF